MKLPEYYQDPSVAYNQTNVNRMAQGLENRGLDQNVLNRLRGVDTTGTMAMSESMRTRSLQDARDRGLMGVGAAANARQNEAALAFTAQQKADLRNQYMNMDAQMRQQNLARAAGMYGDAAQIGLQSQGQQNLFGLGQYQAWLQKRAQDQASKWNVMGMLGGLGKGVAGLVGGPAQMMISDAFNDPYSSHWQGTQWQRQGA